jgi:hypothetical protein
VANQLPNEDVFERRRVIAVFSMKQICVEKSLHSKFTGQNFNQANSVFRIESDENGKAKE